MYAKFRCTPLRIKKVLGIFRELITTTTTTTTRTTTRLAFWNPPSGSKKWPIREEFPSLLLASVHVRYHDSNRITKLRKSNQIPNPVRPNRIFSGQIESRGGLNRDLNRIGFAHHCTYTYFGHLFYSDDLHQ